MALNLVCNVHDRRSISAKLKAIGVTTAQWNAWLRNKGFEETFRKEMARRFGTVDIDAQMSLTRLVQEGDLSSIKYFHELTGVYNPNTELTMNLGSILAALMEILARYVASDVLTRIADDFEGVLNPNRPPSNILELVGTPDDSA